MIIVASASPRESAALVALCEDQGWSVSACATVRAVIRNVHRRVPKLVLVRHTLDDGYSDDVILALGELGLLPRTRVAVLVGAETPTSTHVRQITLGADVVQRDPVRVDILLAYLKKYMNQSIRPAGTGETHAPRTVEFSGAKWEAAERALTFRTTTVSLTPRETLLIELLAHSAGEVVTYETLYGEILGRPFRGDTSNMRVLLGKLTASLDTIGIALRDWVEVIPKTGYRYRNAAPPALKVGARR